MGGFFYFGGQILLLTWYDIGMGGKGCLYAGDGISGRAEASAENFASY